MSASVYCRGEPEEAPVLCHSIHVSWAVAEEEAVSYVLPVSESPVNQEALELFLHSRNGSSLCP